MITRDFLGREWDIHCMGCAIVDESMAVPGGFIQKQKYFCLHQDPLIPLPGFLVIASVRHIRSLSEMTPEEYEEFSSLLRTTHAAIRSATSVEHLTIVQEEQSVHFHLWFFPWTSQVLEKYGSPSLTKIREIMADYRKESIGGTQWQELEESIRKIKQYQDI